MPVLYNLAVLYNTKGGTGPYPVTWGKIENNLHKHNQVQSEMELFALKKVFSSKEFHER